MNKSLIFACTAFLLCAAASSACSNEIAVGKTAPDFVFTNAVPMAKQVKLSDYRGTPVALHFWATWCGPCVSELPLIAELTASKSGGLAVLAVNCAEPKDLVSAFLEKQKLKLDLVLDEDASISRLYKIDAIPQTYMIDKNGIIRSIKIGAYTKNELDRDVSALLAE
jgi:peroxiredoxin